VATGRRQLDQCFLAFGMHHVFSLLSFKMFYMVDYYPAFMIFVLAYHSVVVGAPKFPLNNYIYAVTIAYWFYGLFSWPFRKRRVYFQLGLQSLIILIPISMLGLFKCMHK